MSNNKKNVNVDLGFAKENPLEKQSATKVRKINIGLLMENPINAEMYDDTTVERQAQYDLLKKDITENGMLQPIVILRSDTHQGRYEIIAGHRRKKIAEELGWTEVEAIEMIAKTADDKLKTKLAYISTNALTRKSTPSEQAKQVEYLKSIGSELEEVTNVANWIAEQLDISRRSVFRSQQLNELPEEIKAEVDAGKISVSQALKKTPEEIKEEQAKKKAAKEEKQKAKENKPMNYHKVGIKINSQASNLFYTFENDKDAAIDGATIGIIKDTIEKLQKVVDKLA